MLRLVGVLAAPVLLSSCSLDCTLLDCESDAALTVTASTQAAFANATIRVCQNDRCTAFQLDSAGAQPVDDSVDRTFVSSIAFDTRGTTLTTLLKIDAGTAGDAYSIELESADGDVVAQQSWRAASYRKNQPNGAECDRDYFCINPELVEQ